MRLLLVEDNQDLANALLGGLRAYGYAPDHAGDGEEAQQFVDAGTYQAIVLDLSLIHI